jgi:hypothetical protein
MTPSIRCCATFAAAALWSAHLASATAADRSCNGLQLVQITGQLKNSPASAAERQRWNVRIHRFHSAVEQVGAAGQKDEVTILGLRAVQIEALFLKAPPQTQQDALNYVMRTQPSLFRAAQAGNQEAKIQLALAVYSKFADDHPTVYRSIEPALFRSGPFTEAMSNDQRRQDQLHEIEKQQFGRAAVPMNVTLRELTQKQASDREIRLAVNDPAQQSRFQGLAEKSRGFRDALAAADLAAHLSAGNSSFRAINAVSDRSQMVFDDSARGTVAVSQVAVAVAGTRLQARLDYNDATTRYLPADPRVRREVAQDRNSPLARSSAETLARSTASIHYAQLTANRLHDAVERNPLPPITGLSDPDAAGKTTEWVRKFANEIRNQLQSAIDTRELP